MRCKTGHGTWASDDCRVAGRWTAMVCALCTSGAEETACVANVLCLGSELVGLLRLAD